MDWDYTQTKPRKGEVVNGKRQIYAYSCYNHQPTANDKIRRNKLLDILEEKIDVEQLTPDHESFSEKYFQTADTRLRGGRIQPKQVATG